MSPVKEPCYFASELRAHNFSDELQPWITSEAQILHRYLRGPMRGKRFGGLVSQWDDYRALFRDSDGATAIGEASVCYLWSQTAAKNIFFRLPDSKIVMMLRNPVERAFSQYLHALGLGAIHKPFREQAADSLSARASLFGILYPFLDFGLY